MVLFADRRSSTSSETIQTPKPGAMIAPSASARSRSSIACDESRCLQSAQSSCAYRPHKDLPISTNVQRMPRSPPRARREVRRGSHVSFTQSVHPIPQISLFLTNAGSSVPPHIPRPKRRSSRFPKRKCSPKGLGPNPLHLRRDNRESSTYDFLRWTTNASS